MIICAWTFTGFFALSLFLYILFFAKKNILLYKIFSCFPLVFLSLAFEFFLTQFFPDSIHILIFSSIACILCFSAKIVLAINENQVLQFIAKGLYAFSFVFYDYLLKTIFYAHHIPSYASIIFAFTYIALLVSIFLIIKKQPVIYILLISIIEAVLSVFTFFALLSLIYEPSLNSLFMLFGAVIAQSYSILYFLDVHYFKMKNGKLIREIMLFTSQIFIYLGFILIFV